MKNSSINCIQKQLNNSISQPKETWTRDEVVDIIKEIVKEISFGNESLLHHYNLEFRDLDKWIQDNLK